MKTFQFFRAVIVGALVFMWACSAYASETYVEVTAKWVRRPFGLAPYPRRICPIKVLPLVNADISSTTATHLCARVAELKGFVVAQQEDERCQKVTLVFSFTETAQGLFQKQVDLEIQGAELAGKISSSLESETVAISRATVVALCRGALQHWDSSETVTTYQATTSISEEDAADGRMGSGAYSQKDRLVVDTSAFGISSNGFNDKGAIDFGLRLTAPAFDSGIRSYVAIRDGAPWKTGNGAFSDVSAGGKVTYLSSGISAKLRPSLEVNVGLGWRYFKSNSLRRSEKLSCNPPPNSSDCTYSFSIRGEFNHHSLGVELSMLSRPFLLGHYFSQRASLQLQIEYMGLYYPTIILHEESSSRKEGDDASESDMRSERHPLVFFWPRLWLGFAF